MQDSGLTAGVIKLINTSMRKRFIVVAVLLLAGGARLGHAAPARLTLGTRGGEEVSASGEALIPLRLTDTACLFALPRLERTDRDDTQAGFGLGVRQMARERLILGGNLFYDSQWTRNNNRFHQLGGGVELLTRWVDVRANYYLPERGAGRIESLSLENTEVRTGASAWSGASARTDYGDLYEEDHALLQESTTVVEQWSVAESWRRETTTTRWYDRFEEALRGWDAEVGVRLPIPDRWGQYRLFGGYYDFKGELTEPLQGFKGRFEARVLFALTLDVAVFEDRALYGTDWYAGFRVTVPLDLANLASGKNPFKGAFQRTSSSLRSRLLEPVMRERMVVQETGWIEDVEKMQVEVKNSSRTDVQRSVSTNTATHTVLGDVNFVNSGAGTNGEGTAEAPYATIQAGVSNAFGAGNVYVHSGSYSGVVQATQSVSIYGAGAPIAGLGGKTYGGGEYPELSGSIHAEGISSFALSGLHLRDSGVDVHGIYLRNVGQIDIWNNRISGTGARAINVVSDNGEDCVSRMEGNEISGYRAGIYFDGSNRYSLITTVRGNEMSYLNSSAVGFRLTGDGTMRALVEQNDIREINRTGIFASIGGSGRVELSIADNTIHRAALIGNATRGIEIQAYGFYSPTVRLRVEGNTITECGGEGMLIDVGGTASMSAGIRRNTLLGNNQISGVNGLVVATYSYGGEPRLCLQLMNNVSNTGFVLDNGGGLYAVEDVLDKNQGQIIIFYPGVTLVPYGSCNTP